MRILQRQRHECVFGPTEQPLREPLEELWHPVGVYHFQCLRGVVLVLVGEGAEEAEGAGDAESGPDVEGANDLVEGADCEVDEGGVDELRSRHHLFSGKKALGLRDTAELEKGGTLYS